MVTALANEQERRIRLAHRVAEDQRAILGAHALAAACYGSVAHGRADAHSDLELLILTDDGVPPVDIHVVEDDVQVECDVLSLARLLNAARRVTPEWGFEADCYRCHLVLWDPHHHFDAVRTASLQIPAASFAEALEQSWWSHRELAEKVRAACEAGDPPSVHHAAWQYLVSAAARIALHERRPYESLRALWVDVTRRGYGTREMVVALTSGPLDAVLGTLALVEAATGAWGAPVDPSIPFRRPRS